MEHTWYKCDGIKCRDTHCVYCDGGLSYCVVCKKGEAELEPTCPGPLEEADDDSRNQS